VKANLRCLCMVLRAEKAIGSANAKSAMYMTTFPTESQ
jgi:hypothetical protein